MTRIDCALRYGQIVSGVWADEAKHCIAIAVPEGFHDVVINSATGKGWRQIYCNKDMVSPLLRALSNVKRAGLISEVKTFDGCFCIRDTRGNPGKISAHSYGLAIDLNAAWNPLGGQSTWSPEFIKCFTEEGFVWGGAFERKDPQHFSWAGF